MRAAPHASSAKHSPHSTSPVKHSSAHAASSGKGRPGSGARVRRPATRLPCRGRYAVPANGTPHRPLHIPFAQPPASGALSQEAQARLQPLDAQLRSAKAQLAAAAARLAAAAAPTRSPAQSPTRAVPAGARARADVVGSRQQARRAPCQAARRGAAGGGRAGAAADAVRPGAGAAAGGGSGRSQPGDEQDAGAELWERCAADAEAGTPGTAGRDVLGAEQYPSPGSAARPCPGSAAMPSGLPFGEPTEVWSPGAAGGGDAGLRGHAAEEAALLAAGLARGGERSAADRADCDGAGGASPAGAGAPCEEGGGRSGHAGDEGELVSLFTEEEEDSDATRSGNDRGAGSLQDAASSRPPAAARCASTEAACADGAARWSACQAPCMAQPGQHRRASGAAPGDAVARSAGCGDVTAADMPCSAPPRHRGGHGGLRNAAAGSHGAAARWPACKENDPGAGWARGARAAAPQKRALASLYAADSGDERGTGAEHAGMSVSGATAPARDAARDAPLPGSGWAGGAAGYAALAACGLLDGLSQAPMTPLKPVRTDLHTPGDARTESVCCPLVAADPVGIDTVWAYTAGGSHAKCSLIPTGCASKARLYSDVHVKDAMRSVVTHYSTCDSPDGRASLLNQPLHAWRAGAPGSAGRRGELPARRPRPRGRRRRRRHARAPRRRRARRPRQGAVRGRPTAAAGAAQR